MSPPPAAASVLLARAQGDSPPHPIADGVTSSLLSGLTPLLWLHTSGVESNDAAVPVRLTALPAWWQRLQVPGLANDVCVKASQHHA